MQPERKMTAKPELSPEKLKEIEEYDRKSFTSDQIVRWCPGCGDYSILAQMQKTMPAICQEQGIPRENVAVVSGIGCSSRFPYYMNTYGFHSIHGRAPTFASGLKISRPELQVWVVTGDGDALSIGGNHLIHALRRNIDLKILLFNNRIYGLTKGQYSPTSEQGKKTKSTPHGSVDYPINPLSLALAAEATFVARTIDADTKHLASILKRAALHKGSAFIEIYQNCNIFNDGAFKSFADKKVRDDRTIVLEHGQPMVFGKERDKGIRLDGLKPVVVDLANGAEESSLLVHARTGKQLLEKSRSQFFVFEAENCFHLLCMGAPPEKRGHASRDWCGGPCVVGPSSGPSSGPADVAVM
jgi:2-oxoglutarate ferredoxin oxidoreductase subunit beta